jgi:hypothetical protein
MRGYYGLVKLTSKDVGATGELAVHLMPLPWKKKVTVTACGDVSGNKTAVPDPLVGVSGPCPENWLKKIVPAGWPTCPKVAPATATVKSMFVLPLDKLNALKLAKFILTRGLLPTAPSQVTDPVSWTVTLFGCFVLVVGLIVRSELSGEAENVQGETVGVVSLDVKLQVPNVSVANAGTGKSNAMVKQAVTTRSHERLDEVRTATPCGEIQRSHRQSYGAFAGVARQLKGIS